MPVQGGLRFMLMLHWLYLWPFFVPTRRAKTVSLKARKKVGSHYNTFNSIS